MAKKILLADDSITIQKVVELTFSEGDYEVFCASDGAQAIRKIEEIVPDIALVDVMMPQRNGYDVCAHVKKDPNLAWIPVLLLTGTFEPYDPKRAGEVGADGHIIKPFESRALVGQVEDLVSRHPRPGARGESRAPVMPPPAAAPQEARERPAPAPPAALGPATVRIDSRAFFNQMEPAAPPAAPTPSLGPLDLGSGEGSIEPTRPMRATAPRPPAPAPVAATVPKSAGPREEDIARAAREKVEELARPIIEKAAEKIIQEIAWEVIPELAETIIKHRIKELEEEAASEGGAPLH